MRFRIAAILLSAIMLAGLAGCKKKEEATQTPPASTDQQSQSAPAATPAPGQQAAAPEGTPGQAPAETAAAPAPAPAAEEPPPPPPPPPIVIPAGKTITVRVGETLSSKSAQDGQPFNGTLANGIAVNGKVVIPAGSAVSGVVTEAKSAGKFKGEAVLAIKITSINVKGVPHEVNTDEYVVTQKGKGKRTAVMIGGGTGAGALIGGIAGGGKGALIGGLVGAGAGTAGAAFTGNKELTIPAESAASFTTKAPITIQPQAPAQ
jgi:LysM repeat protein